MLNLHFLFRSSEQALQDQRQLRQDLQSDVGSSKDRVHEIQKQLDDVVEQLGDARTDKHEDARRKKKQEIVERFKSNYPGVVSIQINIKFPLKNGLKYKHFMLTFLI